MNKFFKIFAVASLVSYAFVPTSFAATTEQILEFRLERIPEALTDPSRAVLFSPRTDDIVDEEQSAKNKSEYFELIHNSPNNVAIGYAHNGNIATSFNYQATDSTPFFMYSVTKFVVGS